MKTLRMAAIVVALFLAGCQTTISGQVLLSRSGTGSTRLPPFTSKGAYAVTYSFGQCPGNVTGLMLLAYLGSSKTSSTLQQSLAQSGSGTTAATQAGEITLEVVSQCQWKITVTG